ncbi:MAG TPA: FAD-dependent oxidoreductase [Gemmatimonadaceae bacterium]|nr:FAD-dependent oxidoreductase [Gemmatimonadaceae bacterium]
MQRESGDTISLWMATADVPEHSPLDGDAEADVCVVGAGIAGLSVAYLLARDGRRVIVIDDGPIGGGETSRTTAHLSFALDDGYARLERMHGEEGARLAAESHIAAVDLIERIVADESIACDFERLDGYLFLGPGDSAELLDRELEAAQRAGVPGVERVPRAPRAPFDTGPALRFPRQGQFHPLRYLAGLARRIVQRGGRIHAGSHVEEISGGTECEVTTSDGHGIRAGAVVVATNSPVSDYVVTHVKQAPYRSFVIAARVPRRSIPTELYWDTADPYHYVRLHPAGGQGAGGGRDLLVVGGEDHKTGQKDDADERFGRLEAWTRARFPMVTDIAYRWSGQVLEPNDSLAFIGRQPGREKNIYIATGDSGHGMTHGTIAGLLLTDLIAGREHRWATLYDPSRITVSRASAAEFAKENLNVAVQYADWIRPGEVGSADEIRAGTGALLREGTKILAAYRDDEGALHLRSAVCTHLKCIVDWNSAEKSWDCPCHGSRFDPYGRVLNGPAIAPLEEVDAEVEAKVN